MTKRIVVIILSLILMFSVCGCKSTDKAGKKSKAGKSEIKKTFEISLLYNKSDTFNPYTATTENNRNLTKLLYEPLFKATDTFTAKKCLAKEYSFDGNKCIVTLENTVFTDGTPLTADDVVYSYNTAKNYGGLYTSHLYEAVSCTALSAAQVLFGVSQTDPYFVNLLDFPVIKSGSDKATNSDGVTLTPIGCGRYSFTDGNDYFSLNEAYKGKKGNITKIKLINAPDSDSAAHYVEIGATGIYYTDLSDGDIVRMSGKKTDVNLNNFVYIGINSSVSGLDNKFMRYALSSAIDRSAVCLNAYYNNASPAKGFINPSVKEVKAVQSLKKSADNEITVENLSKMGYNRLDENGWRVNDSGYHITYSLLVNSENRSRVLAANLIAGQLKNAGIEIKVVEAGYDTYREALSTNSFQLYLGEISVAPNLDMTSLVVPGGSAAYGVGLEPVPLDENGNPIADSSQNGVTNILSAYHSGQNSISDVAGVMLTEMPQIPVCYRKGLLFYSDKIVSEVKSFESDIYYSIENYETK